MQTTVNPRPAPETESDLRSWRKRHPVLSRLLLYVFGAGIVAALVVLLGDRKAEDEAALLLARQKELENLPSVLLPMDPQGDALLDQLEITFPEATLEPELRALRHRVKAMAFRGGGRNDEARRELEAAEALPGTDEQDVALALEFAEFELQTDALDEAVARLEALTPKLRPSAPEVLIREALLAQAKCLRTTNVEGVATLRALLERLPTPAPKGPTLEASGQSWTPLDAIQAATGLVARMDPEAAPAVRARLVDHIGGDVQQLIALVTRFAEIEPSVAKRALQAARAVDAGAVKAHARASGTFRDALSLLDQA